MNYGSIEDLKKRNQTLEKRWKIILVLLVVFVLSRPVAVYIINNLIKDAKTNHYPLIDPARELIPQENFIINIQPLREYMHSLPSQLEDGNEITIYYEQLNSGANISVNKDLRFYQASLSKIPVALVIVKKVEQGKLSWDQEMFADETDIDNGGGELYKTLGKNPITIEKLLEEMIVNSDNTARNILVDEISDNDMNLFNQEVGLEELIDAFGNVSAKEYARVLRMLYTSSYLTRENSQKILNWMADSSFREYLSQGLPDGINFAHKYGQHKDQSVFSDAGIVYIPEKPYLLVVLIKGKDSSAATHEWAKNMMKEISQKAYEQGISN